MIRNRRTMGSKSFLYGSLIAASKRRRRSCLCTLSRNSLVFYLLVRLCSISLHGQASVHSEQNSTPQSATPKPDTIFLHGNVYTGVPANSQFSSILRQEAIAVREGRIQAVGKNAEIEKLKGPQTQVVDLGGHFVMPGFNDAHIHLAEAGLQKLSVDLTGVKSLDEMRERVL